MPRLLGAEACLGIMLSDGEEALGLYQNEKDEDMAITTSGLRFGNRALIRYKDIAGAKIVGEKEAAEHIELTLENGSGVRITIDGGRGRFRDSWEILRLLDRIRSAVNMQAARSSSESPPV